MLHRSKNVLGTGHGEYFNEKRPVNVSVHPETVDWPGGRTRRRVHGKHLVDYVRVYTHSS